MESLEGPRAAREGVIERVMGKVTRILSQCTVKDNARILHSARKRQVQISLTCVPQRDRTPYIFGGSVHYRPVL